MSPFEILGLPADASAGEVKARWRVLRSELHPDRGGDAWRFDQAKQAYEKAYAEAQRCKQCRGKGKVLMANGFSQLTVSCPHCRGTGVGSE